MVFRRLKHVHGIGFAIPNLILTKLPETPLAVNEHLMRICIRLVKGRHAKVLKLHVPTMKCDNKVKNEVYEALRAILRRAPHTDKIILSDDLNAIIDSNQTIWSNVLGKRGNADVNSNVYSLLNFCSEFGLFITNTHFLLKIRYKSTWNSRSKHWHPIDYIFAKRPDVRNVVTIRVLLGAGCRTVDTLVCSSLQLRIWQVLKRKPWARFNVVLINAEKERVTCIRILITLLPSIQLTIFMSLFKKTQMHDWFDRNNAEIQNIFRIRNAALAAKVRYSSSTNL